MSVRLFYRTSSRLARGSARPATSLSNSLSSSSSSSSSPFPVQAEDSEDSIESANSIHNRNNLDRPKSKYWPPTSKSRSIRLSNKYENNIDSSNKSAFVFHGLSEETGLLEPQVAITLDSDAGTKDDSINSINHSINHSEKLLSMTEEELTELEKIAPRISAYFDLLEKKKHMIESERVKKTVNDFSVPNEDIIFENGRPIQDAREFHMKKDDVGMVKINELKRAVASSDIKGKLRKIPDRISSGLGRVMGRMRGG